MQLLAPGGGRARSFYTVAADHYNCPIGSYTHNIALPPERAPELEQTFSLMASLGYVKMEEVPGIPAPARAARRGRLCAAWRNAGRRPTW